MICQKKRHARLRHPRRPAVLAAEVLLPLVRVGSAPVVAMHHHPDNLVSVAAPDLPETARPRITPRPRPPPDTEQYLPGQFDSDLGIARHNAGRCRCLKTSETLEYPHAHPVPSDAGCG